ncbi:DMT family transporter [uncultured Clostridium sp.]|uniref:DMT family transporter n=1 Tax=uncultured Clostridium sp. TaxID=59620 RepID=UPI0026073C7C|nr:DMT family transporter [uncultured Clostridium sp.]
MFGIVFSIIAGLTMSLQGVFNTRVSEKIGLWETNLIVQGTAFLFTLIVYFFFKSGNLANLKSTNKLYLLGGFIGVIITYTVMRGIDSLGPTFSISIILISQLLSAALIDALGLFNTTKINFHWNNYLGIALMLIGILLFQFKK